ncbi:DUF2079 domain-containing protein [Parasphingorhabdus pacifica]
MLSTATVRTGLTGHVGTGRAPDDHMSADWPGPNRVRVRHALPWAVAGLFFALYSAVSIREHHRMRSTGYDLGIFEQIVRSYSEGRAPVSELLGPGANALGDHFHPILALLAPLYLVWPSAEVLLLAQAALLALAIVPLMRWATRELGVRAALVVGFGMGASYGFQGAVGFDFHEVCFAAPLLAFSLEALGERRWRSAAAWALPLLLVKEDLGLTVAVLGGYLLYQGQRRVGAVAVSAGVLGSLVEIFVLIPWFNADGGYRLWENFSPDFSGSLFRVPVELVTPDIKAQTLVLLLAPTAFVALRSPLLLLAVPTLLWRLLSSNQSYWDTEHHYSVVLMPIVFAAFVDALTRLRQVSPTVLAGSVLVTTVFLPSLPLASLFEAQTWRTDARVVAARQVLDRIPDGASVAASNMLVPQLTSRCEVSVFPGYPDDSFRTEWIVSEADPPARWPVSADAEREYLRKARDAGYRTVADEGGFLLLRR